MNTQEPQGVIIINKPQGVSSFDVVNKMRRLFMTKRIGHTGTLDPDATGVLVVLIGRAAKAAEYIVSDGKSYEATLRLGLTTTTEDATGEILTSTDILPEEEAVIRACSGFTGDITQIPPMYSALKVNGRKLCNLARKGVEVERQPRSVSIYRLDCKKLTGSDYALSVDCSKGTYIRTLCADIGQKLGCGGIMASLNRTRSGNFTLDGAYTVEQLQALEYEERLGLLIPTESLFSELPVYAPVGFFLHLCKSGCELYQSKIKTEFTTGQYVRLYDEEGFFAIGRVEEFEDGSAIKPVKVFRLNNENGTDEL